MVEKTFFGQPLIVSVVERVSDEQFRVRVDIFGRQYTLRGSGSPDRLTRIAKLVDGKMNELFAQNGRLDVHTLAILAALNFAEEYHSLAEEYDALLRALEADSDGKQ